MQHMMDMENTRQYLSNLYENYLLDRKEYASPAFHGKCLGAIEATLVILGTLQPGTPFQYQESINTFKLFWLFPIKYKKKESYPEHILRLALQTLTN